ncbi:hypothetical protein [Nocardia pseudovaccinii]|uniref:hypothetical protein n=1 Tax=Nocardia pseudovaccinii TaxID=189540 RepID=UPI001470A5B0|nr:hypothetical protein [Nocardia pseudovaccinii]
MALHPPGHTLDVSRCGIGTFDTRELRKILSAQRTVDVGVAPGQRHLTTVEVEQCAVSQAVRTLFGRDEHSLQQREDPIIVSSSGSRAKRFGLEFARRQILDLHKDRLHDRRNRSAVRMMDPVRIERLGQALQIRIGDSLPQSVEIPGNASGQILVSTDRVKLLNPRRHSRRDHPGQVAGRSALGRLDQDITRVGDVLLEYRTTTEQIE